MTIAKTRVYLTVDVECAEERLVRGRIQPPQGYDTQIWGRFRNQREELGIGRIMHELEAEGHAGTFFVETVGATHFGVQGLRDVCSALRGRGHDVQLHLHPILSRATFRSGGEPPVPDDIADYPVDEQAQMLRDGVSQLVAAGIPRDEIRAYRAGNFGASNETWRAMKQAGLTLSSNYNPCYFEKGCRMRWDRAEAGLFRTSEEGVWELPISCVREPGGGMRHMQITAMSLDEMKECLLQSRALGIGEVTFVTHSFELQFVDSARELRAHKNRVNIARLRGLCRFLRQHRHDFTVETVGALAARLPLPPRAIATSYPRGKRLQRYRRLIEQGKKRILARVPIG